VFATDGAAGFLAELALSAPTVVEIVGEGPLGTEHAIQRTSKTMLVVPGRDVLGEGVILELMGFTVTLESPTAGTSIAPGTDVSATARVTMLCGCPTQPGGLWDADRMEITLRAVRDGHVLNEWPMAYAGETSTYEAVFRVDEPGEVMLQVIASEPATANFGMVEAVVTVVR